MGAEGKAASEHRSERTRRCVSKAEGANAAIDVQPHAGYEEAPGEDRGFIAEEEEPFRLVL